MKNFNYEGLESRQLLACLNMPTTQTEDCFCLDTSSNCITQGVFLADEVATTALACAAAEQAERSAYTALETATNTFENSSALLFDFNSPLNKDLALLKVEVDVKGTAHTTACDAAAKDDKSDATITVTLQNALNTAIKELKDAQDALALKNAEVVLAMNGTGALKATVDTAQFTYVTAHTAAYDATTGACPAAEVAKSAFEAYQQLVIKRGATSHGIDLDKVDSSTVCTTPEAHRAAADLIHQSNAGTKALSTDQEAFIANAFADAFGAYI